MKESLGVNARGSEGSWIGQRKNSGCHTHTEASANSMRSLELRGPFRVVPSQGEGLWPMYPQMISHWMQAALRRESAWKESAL